MMIARATGAGDVPPRAFQAARKKLLQHDLADRLAPECVRYCRDPDAVWSYIKSQNPDLPSYESRRVFLRAQFEPLLSALERFAPRHSTSLSPAMPPSGRPSPSRQPGVRPSSDGPVIRKARLPPPGHSSNRHARRSWTIGTGLTATRTISRRSTARSPRHCASRRVITRRSKFERSLAHAQRWYASSGASGTASQILMAQDGGATDRVLGMPRSP
jgi:hypothetical protein